MPALTLWLPRSTRCRLFRVVNDLSARSDSVSLRLSRAVQMSAPSFLRARLAALDGVVG